MATQPERPPTGDRTAEQQQRLADIRARVQRVGGVSSLSTLVAKFGHWHVAEALGKVNSPKG